MAKVSKAVCHNKTQQSDLEKLSSFVQKNRTKAAIFTKPLCSALCVARYKTLCNAWNHPLNCTCGWGGNGHSGSLLSNFGAQYSCDYYGIPPFTQTLESFTIPNAQCPVCGATVFYYSNSYGSSVFFDELGPPWPKHPCTDNVKIKYTHKVLAEEKRIPIEPSWQAQGWVILGISLVTDIDKNTLKIESVDILSKRGIIFYMQKKPPSHGSSFNHALSPKRPAMFREQAGRKYISFIDEHGASYEAEVYRFRSDIHAKQTKIKAISFKSKKPISNIIPSAQTIPKKDPTIKPTLKKPPVIKLKLKKTTGLRAKNREKTAMEIAFAKARKKHT